eukprot:2183118-Rhodomonas_salina.2
MHICSDWVSVCRRSERADNSPHLPRRYGHQYSQSSQFRMFICDRHPHHPLVLAEHPPHAHERPHRSRVGARRFHRHHRSAASNPVDSSWACFLTSAAIDGDLLPFMLEAVLLMTVMLTFTAASQAYSASQGCGLKFCYVVCTFLLSSPSKPGTARHLAFELRASYAMPVVLT